MLIRLYGPVEIGTGQSSHRIVAPKRACVLAALASAPGVPMSTFELISRVWGTEPPDTAISTLYSHIARLRATLRHNSRLRVERDGPHGYVLHVDPESVDVHLVRKLTARARRRATGDPAAALTLWRNACELAHGEALVGVGGSWAAEYRTTLRRERLQLLSERYTAELELGHHADAVSELAEVVAREPLFEPLIARHMLALYRCGRTSEALDRYEELRVRLRDHSGADPSDELRRLHTQILRHDPSLHQPETPAHARPAAAPVPVTPAQLPADTPGFHGRDAELTAIVSQAGRGGVVVIDGMAGVGKTALALRAAHRLAPEYPDGQLFLDLHGYAENLSPTAPADALARLLRALDAEIPVDVDDRAAALRTALAGRRMLLVLDNAHDAEQVRPLLPGNTECLTVITARRRLVDLVDARPVSLATLPIPQAARLFAAEAGVEPDADTVRVAELCGGLPLAIRIAASRLRHRPDWSAAELARRLSRGRPAIRELDGAGRVVTAAFELSYQELDETARHQFRLLSVFPGSEFDGEAAAALAGVEPAEAEPLLELLVDAQLLTSLGASRYRMHDLLREYATQQVTDDTERKSAWLRLAEHYLATTHAATAVLTPQYSELSTITPRRKRPAPEDPAEWIHAELPVLERLVITAMAAGDHGIARDLSQLVLGGLVVRFNPGVTSARMTLATHGERAALALGDHVALANMAGYLGASYISLARFDEARHHLSRALEIWCSIEDASGESVARNGLARIALQTGRLAAAAREFQTATELAEAVGKTINASTSRLNSIGALIRLDRLTEAEELLERAHAQIVAADNRYELIRVDYYQGMIATAKGDYGRAAKRLHEAIARCREYRTPERMLFALAALTDNDLLRGDYAEAAEHAQKQLGLLDPEILSPVFEARALRQIGAARTGLGEHDDALADLRAAEQRARDARAELEVADTARALGDLHSARGDPAEARRAYARALAFYVEGGLPDAEGVRRALDACAA